MSTVVEKKRGGYTVRGSKGKGGGGGRAPVEARDSLHSIVYAAILDLLSEGEIEGLVNGLQSVVLDGTPLQNSDGTFNFEDVTVDYRSGTVDQEYIKGFPSVEATTAIQLELKHGSPWVRSVTNTTLSAVRVTLGTNGLSQANTTNGDISGYVIEYKIELQTDGGAWEVVVDSSLAGKTTSTYRRTHRIDLPKATTSWLLRVTRITPDSDSSAIADGMIIDSFSEVIDAKLRFPNSALAGIRLNAQQFRSIPTRAYHLRGRRVRVPVNYDPVTRTYTGVWNGQFKIAYTNNPAWVFYDIATHKRYGLGKKIPEALLNKGALYQIAAYCDELVSDGKGGLEPRFTCNVYLQKEADAYKVLQDLVSIFRGMTYYSSSAIHTVADMPRDAVYNYNQTNVVGGRFAYSGIDIEQRYTVALVSYSDMTDYGRQKVVYVQDADAIRRYGVNKTEVVAFGCTSESQAQRLGKWVLASSKFETQTAAFTVDRSGQIVTPGKVVKIMDSAFAGKRLGGRIVSATETQAVLDKPCDAVIGDVLTVNLPTGIATSRYITGVSTVEGVQTLTVGSSFGGVPTVGASWCVDTEEVASREFSILSVKDNQDGTFAVTALQHERQKFDFIDNGTKIDPKPVTIVPPGVQAAPADVTLATYDCVADDGTSSMSVMISWPSVENGSSYDVEWNRSNSGWVRMPRTQLREVEIRNAFSGEYVARVRAVSAIEIPSNWVVSDVLNVVANSKPPRNYDVFTVQELPGGLRKFNFEYTTMDPPADLAGAEIRYVIGHPAEVSWESMTPMDAGYYTSAFTTTQPEAGLWTFACRARNRSGKLSEGMLVRQVELEENFNQEHVPDLTPPPKPTGFDGYVGLSVATLFTALPTYTQGHGHKLTKFYAAEITVAKPNPVFVDAVQVADTSDTHATATVIVGNSYRFWATWTSVDGVESLASDNYVTIIAGKVGDSELADDLDIASKLADGSLSGSKLAAESLDATKFASGIQPVTVWSGAELPTTKSTESLTWQGKLYTWNGTAYVLPPAGELADGSVTAAKIASSAVDATKIAAGVELVKIWTGGALPTTNQGTVLSWNGKLYRWSGTAYVASVATSDLTGQITNTQISDNAVTTPKLAAGAVEADKIAANAVTTAKLAAGAVTADQLAAKSVTANKLVITGTDSVNVDPFFEDATYWETAILKVKAEPSAPYGPNVLYSAGAVSNYMPPSGGRFPIDQSKTYRFDIVIKGAAATTTRSLGIARFYTATGATLSGAGVVGTGWPGTDNSSGNHYWPATNNQTPTVWTRYTLTVGPQGSATFPAGTAFCSLGCYMNYGTGTLVETQLNVLRITEMARGELIVDGAITADKVAANAVTADKLAANAVTADKIAANAVTADAIAANAITAAKIAAGAINAREIAAGAISTEKLLVTATTTTSIDPFFQDTSYWEALSVLVKPVTDNPYGANVLYTSAVVSNYLPAGKVFPIDPTKTYRFEVAIRAVSATTTRAFALVRFYTIDGTPIQGAGSTGWVGTNGANHYFPGSGTTATTSWVLHSLAAGPEGTATIPANAAYCKLGAFFNYSTGTAVETQIGKLQVTQMASANLIVDGAITANKLAANSIAVGTAAIQDGAIVNAHIGNLSADKITAGTLAAARIAAGSIDVTKLAANSVTATQLAANAVIADKISAGAVTVDKLATNSVTAVKIAANTITADKLNVTTLSAIAANLGTVTAGRIQNAANTSYWNLAATGSTTMFKLGSDLEYSEANGLKINKLNVVEVAQLAPGSVSQSQTFSGGPATIWRNTGWNTVLSFTIPPGKGVILSGYGYYVFNSRDNWNSEEGMDARSAELAVVVGSTIVALVRLGPTGLIGQANEYPFSIPGSVGVADMAASTTVYIQVRSVGASPPNEAQRRVNLLNISALIINR